MTPRSRIAALAALTAAALAAPAAAPAAVPTLDVRVAVEVPDGRKATARMTAPGFTGRIGIELRGNRNANYAKKAYSIETRGARGRRGRDVRLLGLPSGNDFVLDPAVWDPTKLRNALVYATSRRMGRWAARTRFVELRLNGRARGLHVLAERPKLADERVDVRRKGISGGYLVEMTQDPEPGAIVGPVTGRPYLLADPERDDASAAERRYITGYVQAAERALARGDWRRFWDEEAAVDHLLIQELVRNQDALHRSVFLHKGTGGRLVLGPAWDFDLSLGRVMLGDGGPVGWTTPARPIANQLLRDPAFAARLAARWRALRADRLVERMRADALRMEREVRAANARDARLWPDLDGDGHAVEVDRLVTWIDQRAAWMDANVDGLGAVARATAPEPAP
jgi:hypothetical protein